MTRRAFIVLFAQRISVSKSACALTVTDNIDYFARIGPDPSWAAGVHYTDDI